MALQFVVYNNVCPQRTINVPPWSSNKSHLIKVSGCTKIPLQTSKPYRRALTVRLENFHFLNNQHTSGASTRDQCTQAIFDPAMRLREGIYTVEVENREDFLVDLYSRIPPGTQAEIQWQRGESQEV